jgi:hypothetical protein
MALEIESNRQARRLSLLVKRLKKPANNTYPMVDLQKIVELCWRAPMLAGVATTEPNTCLLVLLATARVLDRSSTRSFSQFDSISISTAYIPNGLGSTFEPTSRYWKIVRRSSGWVNTVFRLRVQPYQHGYDSSRSDSSNDTLGCCHSRRISHGRSL